MTEAITWLGLWLCRLLAFGPRWLLRAIAALVGGLAFRFAARRRAIAMTNLALCFPDWPQEERIRIARQHFYFYARAFLERFEIWFGSPKRLRQRVLIEGMENFLAHQDKPIIILAPHFLGLDAGGVRFQLERQFASMYSHQSNAVLDAWTTQGRTRFNSPVILSRNQSITKIVGHLRRGLPI
jgi:KDO2-lipid IV(A) lauroyltransferase